MNSSKNYLLLGTRCLDLEKVGSALQNDPGNKFNDVLDCLVSTMICSSDLENSFRKCKISTLVLASDCEYVGVTCIMKCC